MTDPTFQARTHPGSRQDMNSTHTTTNPQDVPNLTTAFRTASRFMTGEEYIESLRDGREIYLYGERVKDVNLNNAQI
jgi:hypothetical protein